MALLLTTMIFFVTGQTISGSVTFLETKDDYEQALKNQKVVIYFTASWCSTCKRIEPILKQHAEECPQIKFFKVDIDDNNEVSEAEEIRAMPTTKFYLDGSVKDDLTIKGVNRKRLKKNVQRLDDLKSQTGIIE